MATSSKPPPLPPRALSPLSLKKLQKRPLPPLPEPPPLPPVEKKPIQLAHLVRELEGVQYYEHGRRTQKKRLSEGEKSELDKKIRGLTARQSKSLLGLQSIVRKVQKEKRAQEVCYVMARQAENDKIANQPVRTAKKLFIGSLVFGGVAFLALLIGLHA